MEYTEYARGYDNGFVEANRANRKATDRMKQAESREDELRGAITENSIVLLHLAAASKDETMRALLMSVHDSLTDAL